jgi:hypothetical protein
VAGFRTEKTDLRRLSDQDKEGLFRSGTVRRQRQALKRARAWNGRQAYKANGPKRTEILTPGTGGQSPGIGIQQERYREIGQDKRTSESFRPKMSDNIYEDLYS